MAHTIEREKNSTFLATKAWAKLLSAAVCFQRGQLSQSILFLRQAVTIAESSEMPQLAATAELRIGQLLKGEEGRALKESAEAKLKAVFL